MYIFHSRAIQIQSQLVRWKRLINYSTGQDESIVGRHNYSKVNISNEERSNLKQELVSVCTMEMTESSLLHSMVDIYRDKLGVE